MRRSASKVVSGTRPPTQRPAKGGEVAGYEALRGESGEMTIGISRLKRNHVDTLYLLFMNIDSECECRTGSILRLENSDQYSEILNPSSGQDGAKFLQILGVSLLRRIQPAPIWACDIGQFNSSID